MPNLLFCLTPGTSLASWHRIGTLNRELRLCADYANSGWKVAVLTFSRDRAENDLIPPGLRLVRFPHASLLPFLSLFHRRIGRWADVIKTNQSAMAWHYVRAARRWRKPILLRCGYVAGRNLEFQSGKTPSVVEYQKKEGSAFRDASHVQVTTPVLAEWVTQRYQLDLSRVSVLPNFVDTDVFCPDETEVPEAGSILSIGRLSGVKRFDLLIRAAKSAGAKRLTIVGEGPDRAALERLSRRLEMNTMFSGRVGHDELPGLLRAHELYAQVSAWEGHPKSLVEAMSCACACVVTDSTGLREQLEDVRRGWIAPSDEVGLAHVLRDAMSDAQGRRVRGRTAREHIERRMNYRLIRDTEEAVLRRLAHGASHMN